MKNLEKTTTKNLRVRSIYVFLTLVCIFSSGAVSCSMFKPLTKEEASKQVIKNLLDGCKAGKNSDVAIEMDKIMPLEEKQRKWKKDKIDYSDADHKREVDKFCKETNERFGGGYEFGKTTEQGEVTGIEVFPTGKNEGNIMAFKKEGENYILVDIDPAKR